MHIALTLSATIIAQNLVKKLASKYGNRGICLLFTLLNDNYARLVCC